MTRSEENKREEDKKVIDWVENYIKNFCTHKCNNCPVNTECSFYQPSDSGLLS